MKDVYIFLGPSLPLDRAREVLDAHYLPPVKCGDITELVLDRQPPAAIGIVDGLFEQVPTVWHKEILFALTKGVRVFGASSMGALRAAELHTFGMEGVGSVFEAFRDGTYRDDDEVTIVHAPAEDGYQPLSEAMVNIRRGLADARDAGHVSSLTHDRLTAAAKDTFYPDRSWNKVVRDGEALGVPAGELSALRAFVREMTPDAKRDDALALLTHIRRALDSGLEPFTADFDFEPTFYWEKLIAVVRQQQADRAARESLGAPAASVTDHLWARDPAVADTALLEVLVRQEADRLGVLVPEEVAKRHQAAHHRADLEPALQEQLAERDALKEVLANRLRAELAAPALRELSALGHLASTRAALATVPAAGEAGRPPSAPAQPIPHPTGRGE
jgi:hypothetical protein